MIVLSDDRTIYNNYSPKFLDCQIFQNKFSLLCITDNSFGHLRLSQDFTSQWTILPYCQQFYPCQAHTQKKSPFYEGSLNLSNLKVIWAILSNTPFSDYANLRYIND
jgi:hypothetical protein